MASTQAFETGLQQGLQRGSEGRLRKQALSDEEHTQKINDQLALRSASLEKLRNTPKLLPDGKPNPDFDQVNGDLQKSLQGIRELYHPNNHPNAIQKFGHLLTDALHITKPQPTQNMVIPNPKGLAEPGNLNIWERPTVQNADGSHSSEYSTSFQDDKGREVLVPTIVNGRFLTPDGKKPPEGSDAEKAMFKEAWNHYLQTGENLGKFKSVADANAYAQALHSRGAAPKGVVKQEAKQAAAAQGDAAQAKQFASALPPSDIEQAHRDVQAKMAGLQDQLNQSVKLWDENNKDATPEERDRAHKEMSDALLWGYKPNATSERGNWETINGTIPGPDGKLISTGYSHNKYTNETTGLNGEPLPADFFQLFHQAPKSTRAPKVAWSKDKSGRFFSVQLDDNNQIRPGTENYNVIPPAGMLPNIRTGVYHWVDQDNAVHETPETTTSRKDFTGTVGAGGGTPPPVGTQPRTGVSNPPNNGVVNSTAAPRQTNLQSSPMMKQKIAHNFEKQDRILGYKGSADLTKAKNTQTEAASIADLGDKLAQHAETSPDDMSEADTQFVLKLIKSDAGRVNQQEIEMLFHAGGISEMPERWAAQAGHGQLSTDLRNQLIQFAHDMRDVADDIVAKKMQHPGDSNSPAPPSKGTGGFDWNSAPEHH